MFASANIRNKYAIPDGDLPGFWEENLHADDREYAVQSFRQASLKKDVSYFEHEYRFHGANREVYYIRDKMKLIRNDHGVVTTAIGIWSDITHERAREHALEQAFKDEYILNKELAARKDQLLRTEEELRQINQQLSSSLEDLSEREFILNQSQHLAKIGRWEYDFGAKRLLWSDEVYSIYGVSKSIDLNDFEQVLRLYEERSRDIVNHTLEQMLSGQGLPFDITTQIVTPLGYKKWVRITGYPGFEKQQLTRVIGLSYDITFFKEAESRLRAGEEKFSKAFNNNPDPMVIIREEDLVVVDVNEKAFRVLGYTRQEVVGNVFFEFDFFVDPADRINSLSDHYTSGNELECLWRKKGGQVIQVQISSSRVEIEGRKYFISVIKDISDRKAAEEKFRKAFDLSPDLKVIVRAADLVVVDVNSKLTVVTGYSKEEVLGRSIQDLDWNGEPGDLPTEIFNGQGALDYDVVLKRKNGELFNATVASSQFWISGEKHIITIIRDITEKKSAEEKIRISEANLKATINNTSVMVWSVDREFRYIMMNEPFKTHIQTMYGYPVSSGDRVMIESTDETMLALQHQWSQRYKRALSGETFRLGEERFDRWLDYSLSPIIENGKVIGVSVFAEDVTERIMQEKELAQANKTIAEYKLIALRSVMNPHFVFNALNSIQFFIAKNDRLNAINYLSTFSKLIRGVLNTSINNKIKLSEELELLRHYTDLELVRFDNRFEFRLTVDPSLDPDSIEIPSLLIQPYVENAILHGLYNKTTTGTLKISVYGVDDEAIVFEIEDDGIGRKAAREIRQQNFPGHRSLGSALTEERLNLINKKNEISLEIEDLFDAGRPCGTKVKIWVRM
nr:PAS domain S-box protein [Chryseosolibacter histidini]